jgi:hypothetical protein
MGAARECTHLEIAAVFDEVADPVDLSAEAGVVEARLARFILGVDVGPVLHQRATHLHAVRDEEQRRLCILVPSLGIGALMRCERRQTWGV